MAILQNVELECHKSWEFVSAPSYNFVTVKIRVQPLVFDKLLSLLSRLCDLLAKLWSIVKVWRFFERWPRFRIVTGDHLSARLPDDLVQLLNGAHRVNGRGQKTWQRFFVPMIQSICGICRQQHRRRFTQIN
jgi:hypothetical protein